MSRRNKSGSVLRFTVILAAILVLDILLISPFQESLGFSTGTSSGGGSVYVYTDTSGHVVTTTATTCTTSGYMLDQNGNCVAPGQAYLNLVLHGVTKLLDASGLPISTSTIEIVPTQGVGTPSMYDIELGYDVTGTGIDWSTLQVEISIGGMVHQPSLTNPNTADLVNNAGIVSHTTMSAKSRSNIKSDITVQSSLGGKSWDHDRKVVPTAATIATAKLLPGFTYSLAGETTDTVGVASSPVVALSTLQWHEPETTTQTQTNPPTTQAPQTTQTIVIGTHPPQVETTHTTQQLGGTSTRETATATQTGSQSQTITVGPAVTTAAPPPTGAPKVYIVEQAAMSVATKTLANAKDPVTKKTITIAGQKLDPDFGKNEKPAPKKMINAIHRP